MKLNNTQIAIKITKESSDEVEFQIVYQLEKLRTNSVGKSRTVYQAENDNEVNVISSAYPEYIPTYNTLYIYGNARGRDKTKVFCTKNNFKRIMNTLNKINNSKIKKEIY